MQKIAIIGFGYIGSVIGSVLASKGNKVVGIERNQYIIDCVRDKRSPFTEERLDSLIAKGVDSGYLTVTSDVSTVKDSDVFIITVGTPLSDTFDADLSHLTAACRDIKPYVKPGNLVIVKSTVPPLTTKNVVAPMFDGAHVAFCPERLAEGKAVSEFETIPIVVGGVTEDSGVAAKRFWDEVMSNQTILIKDSVAAEMVKLADNLWIDLNIALAHELAFLCDHLGTDVIEVIRAANTLPKGMSNVNILSPSVGVGGYCLTKDPWFVHQLGNKYGRDLKLPVASRNINDSVPVYAAERIDSFLTEHFGSREKIKIAILGIAFKNDTGDCRYSPTKGFIDKVIDLGYAVDICDPLVLEHDAIKITDKKLNPDIFNTINGAHCVAFLTGHDVFRKLNLSEVAEAVSPGALVFDGRRFFTRQEIAEIESLGMNFRGVGR